MTWNHRVMRSEYAGESYHTIREVFYDEDGNIEGWTAEPIAPQGETPEELRDELQRMLACLDRPVLEEDELVAATENKLARGSS